MSCPLYSPFTVVYLAMCVVKSAARSPKTAVGGAVCCFCDRIETKPLFFDMLNFDEGRKVGMEHLHSHVCISVSFFFPLSLRECSGATAYSRRPASPGTDTGGTGPGRKRVHVHVRLDGAGCVLGPRLVTL